jgi:glycosyltransferase involved in cell wall biosynthesis
MVSIILPCFNAGKYLSTTIDSVINQTHQNWELLIIDDGSTDNTENIIKQYENPRIKYFCHQNSGISKTRNNGLDRMNGDYFCFLDADDFLPSESLESRLYVFHNNPEADFVDGTVQIYDQDLEAKKSTWSPSYRGNPIDELLSLSGKCFFGNTWLVKRNKDKIYQFHEGLIHGEDLLFYIELALQGGHYDYTEDVILHYRKGHSSAMKNLKGLENGYRYIYKAILNQDQIPYEKAEIFKKKAKSIMLKSYLGRLKPYHALLSQVKKW